MLYMDLHKIEGVTAEDVADAHLKDEQLQSKYGVHYLTYWFNEAAGKIFCLVDAPTVNAAVAVHREAHGLVAEEIIEVEARTVDSFLGTPSEAPATLASAMPLGGPLLDTAIRTILFTDIEGSTSLTQQLGDQGAQELLHTHDTTVRVALDDHGGREVKHTGDGIMASFASAAAAVTAALQMQRDLAGGEVHVRIGLNAGEPIAEHDDLFGTAVIMASRIMDRAAPGQVLVSRVVADLCAGKRLEFASMGDATLKGFDEPVPLYEVLA